MAYRFVEQSTFLGRKHMRYGSTDSSEQAMKHLPKVGRVRRIRGYYYKAGDAQFPAVKVYGDNGTIRFSGLSWGYGGQGPRGLQKLFDLLGVNANAATIAVWQGWDKSHLGTAWEIKIS